MTDCPRCGEPLPLFPTPGGMLCGSCADIEFGPPSLSGFDADDLDEGRPFDV